MLELVSVGVLPALTWRCGGIENRTLYMNSGSDVKIRFPFGMCGRGKEGCDGG